MVLEMLNFMIYLEIMVMKNKIHKKVFFIQNSSYTKF